MAALPLHNEAKSYNYMCLPNNAPSFAKGIAVISKANAL